MTAPGATVTSRAAATKAAARLAGLTHRRTRERVQPVTVTPAKAARFQKGVRPPRSSWTSTSPESGHGVNGRPENHHEHNREDEDHDREKHLHGCFLRSFLGDQQEHCDDETAGRKSGSTKPDDDGNQAENHLECQELLRGDPGGRSGSCKSKLQVVDLRTRVEPES